MITLRYIAIIRITLIALLISLIPLSYSLPILDTPTLIISNKNTPDIDYANMIMDKYYLKRKIQILNDSAANIFERKIRYILAHDKNFSIIGNNSKLYVEYDIENNTVKYKKIIYSVKIAKDEVDLFDIKYRILNRSSNKVILYTLSKKITTNSSFDYGDYKVVLKLVSLDNRILVVNIYKDNRLIEKDKELYKDKIFYLNRSIALLYEGTDRGKYVITVYNIIILEDGKDFVLNRNFRVSLSKDKISLIYKDLRNIGNSFHIFNYHIEVINNSPFKYFRVTYINNYTIELEDNDTVDLGEGTFLIKNGTRIFIFKDGEIFDRELKEYYTPSILLDSENVLKTDCNIILVGGPEVNRLTKNISKYLKVPITNTYPGKNTGVIQTIKNPYNPKYSIMVVAGSDRWGTKACVLALLDNVYSGGNITYVKWMNGTYRVLN
ncbi:hypothetical protein MHHB_P0594 [Methanofervidicoccus abyssi]|uniref:S-layer protein outer domain-containing protein n=1 Tax=Methanofervidicoccus abyssi TaxID=2082189 RepID=A0A401HQ19_9EURY|nr:hypothetical protein MHHB_P0594 [Methanofervidicoccus abyssi]